MKHYLDLVARCMAGVKKSDRTGTGTASIFGHQMRFDLSRDFPIVTTKKTHFKSVVAELLWFLSGSTVVQDLQEMGCTIWDEWENPNGTIGPMYGKQWRRFSAPKGHYVDQMSRLVHGLKTDPDSRRHVVTAWNPGELHLMALAPCHAMFQCYVADGKLSLQVYQRSADVFLGVPFNIASYALLTHLLAQQCDYDVGELVWTGGDCHLYSNHVEQAVELLSREPVPGTHLAILRQPADIFSYHPDDFALIGYNPHPAISAPVAV